MIKRISFEQIEQKTFFYRGAFGIWKNEFFYIRLQRKIASL